MAEVKGNIQPWYFPDIERPVPPQKLPADRVPLTSSVSGIVPVQRQRLLVANLHHERT